jgi:NAD(P)-dependent dehydrogenase (short-subunit alcohol dehydrogenase family)
MVLMNHGIFSFGETAQLSYERMIDLVSLAETYLRKNGAWDVNAPSASTGPACGRLEQASLRREISSVAGFPVILASQTDAKSLAFARRPDISVISQQGPATPDHVIRTKRLPLVGRDAKKYAADYRSYFEQHAPSAKQKLTMIDPAPRVVLDAELGLCAVGRTAQEVAVAAEVYEHTIDIILRSTALGGWRALPAKDIFDVEYWELEQAKLSRKGRPPVLAGEIALVTGAASGIGKACAQSLLKRGAAVVGLDINPNIRDGQARADYLGIECDLTNRQSVHQGLGAAVTRFGGLDMLILNAGIFPPSCAIADMTDELWRKVMGLNLDANLALLRECHPLLKLAPNGGRVVIIGSKNVPAPGPGAAAYSASKAAMNQLARVAALEWGKDHIRVNSIHPNQVFDTALWTPEVLESRARHYGLTIEQYKTNNVLQTEIKSADVAELAAEMCGPLFAKTTGAQVPVDGGNERVI